MDEGDAAADGVEAAKEVEAVEEVEAAGPISVDGGDGISLGSVGDSDGGSLYFSAHPSPRQVQDQLRVDALASPESEQLVQVQMKGDALASPNVTNCPLLVKGVLRPVLFVPGSSQIWKPLGTSRVQQQVETIRKLKVTSSGLKLTSADSREEGDDAFLKEKKCTKSIFLERETALMKQDISRQNITELSDQNVTDSVIKYGSHVNRPLHPVLAYILLKASATFTPDRDAFQCARGVIRTLFIPYISEPKGKHQPMLALEAFSWAAFIDFIVQNVHIGPDYTSANTQTFVRTEIAFILNRLYNAQQCLTSSDKLDILPKALDELAVALDIGEEWASTASDDTSNNEVALFRRARRFSDCNSQGTQLYFCASGQTGHVQLQLLTVALLNEHNSRLRESQTYATENCKVDTTTTRNFVNRFNHVQIRSEIQRCRHGKPQSNAFASWTADINAMAKLHDSEAKLMHLWSRYWELLAFTLCIPRRDAQLPDLTNAFHPVMEVYLDVTLEGSNDVVLGPVPDRTMSVMYTVIDYPMPAGGRTKRKFTTLSPSSPLKLNFCNAALVCTRTAGLIKDLAKRSAPLCYPACSAGKANVLRVMREMSLHEHMGVVTFTDVQINGAHLPRLCMYKRNHISDRMLLARLSGGDSDMGAMTHVIDQLQPAIASCTVFVIPDQPVQTLDTIYTKQCLAYAASPTNPLKHGLHSKNGLPIRTGAWALALRDRQVTDRENEPAYTGVDTGAFRLICETTLKDAKTYAIVTSAQCVSLEKLFLGVPLESRENNSAWDATLFWERRLALFIQEAIGTRDELFKKICLPIVKNLTSSKESFHVYNVVHCAMHGSATWVHGNAKPKEENEEATPGWMYADFKPETAAVALKSACYACNMTKMHPDAETTQAAVYDAMLRLMVAVALCECEANRFKKTKAISHEIAMAWRVVTSMFLRMPTCIVAPTASSPVGTWRFNGNLMYTKEGVFSAMQDFWASFTFEIARHIFSKMSGWSCDVTQPPIEILGTPALPITGMKSIVCHALLKYGIIPMQNTMAEKGLEEEERNIANKLRKHLNVINARNTLEYMSTQSRLLSSTSVPKTPKQMQEARRIGPRNLEPYHTLFKRPIENLAAIRTGGAEVASVYAAWNTLFFYMPTPRKPFVTFVKELTVDDLPEVNSTHEVKRALKLLAGMRFKDGKDETGYPSLFTYADSSDEEPGVVYEMAAHVLHAAVSEIPNDELNRINRLVVATRASISSQIEQGTVIETGSTDVMIAGATAAIVEHAVCAHGHQLLAVVSDSDTNCAYRSAMDLVIRNIALQIAIRTLAARTLDASVATDVLFILIGGLPLCLVDFYASINQDKHTETEKMLARLLQHIGADAEVGLDLNKPVTLDAFTSQVPLDAPQFEAIALIVRRTSGIVANKIRIYDDTLSNFMQATYAKVLTSVAESKPFLEKIEDTLDGLVSPETVWARCVELFFSSKTTKMMQIDTKHLYIRPNVAVTDNQAIIAAMQKLRVAFDTDLYQSISDEVPISVQINAEHTKLKQIVLACVRYMTGRLDRMSILDSDTSNAAWVEKLGELLTILSEIVTAEAHARDAAEDTKSAYGIQLTKQMASITSVDDTDELTFPHAWAAYWNSPSHIVAFVHDVGTILNQHPRAGSKNVSGQLQTPSGWGAVVALFTPGKGKYPRRHNPDLPTPQFVKGYSPGRRESTNGPVIDLINTTYVSHKFRIWFLGMNPRTWVQTWSTGAWGDTNAFERYRNGIPMSSTLGRHDVSKLVELFVRLDQWKDDSRYHDDLQLLNIDNDEDGQWGNTLKQRIKGFKARMEKTGGKQAYAFLLPFAFTGKRFWTYIKVQLPTTLGIAAPGFFGNPNEQKSVVLEMVHKYEDGYGGSNETFNLAVRNAFDGAKSTIEEMVRLLVPEGVLEDLWQLPDPRHATQRTPAKHFPRDAYRHFIGTSEGVFAKGSQLTNPLIQATPEVVVDVPSVEPHSRLQSAALKAKQRSAKIALELASSKKREATETRETLDVSEATRKKENDTRAKQQAQLTAIEQEKQRLKLSAAVAQTSRKNDSSDTESVQSSQRSLHPMTLRSTRYNLTSMDAP